ncbi:ABC transporter permease [Butyrivibrio fibrisolvens]|uniref:ABC transporter permease n=1 Tax=Butyrivibrio fibrisolvens TaxID=831 RepID=UPI0020BFE682|nr:ABC transporter permease [Butyrivibrio fibrisolvens]
MLKYLIKRLLHGLFSIVVVIGIVMLLIYSLMDRQLIFAADSVYQNLGNNQKKQYMYRMWENYGYIDYVTYEEYIASLVASGELDSSELEKIQDLGKKAEDDSETVAEYVKKFSEYYESKGYTIVRLDAITIKKGRKYADGGQEALFAYRDKPLLTRLTGYFTGIVDIDSIHYVDDSIDIGKRGISFTLHDPAYGGEKFSPALIGNGTKYKYLLYFDNNFPYIHQNLIKISLGKSYTVNAGIDVFDTMTQSQGSYVSSEVTFPSGVVEASADDLHTATYVKGSLASSTLNQRLFVDDYTNVSTVKNGLSKIGYSFVIGLISSIIAYVLGVSLGIAMARHKDKAIDKIGTIYIVFAIAVPSLAYIFMVKAIGGSAGLPTTFDMESTSKLMYVLPIISLSIKSIADLMKWLRRYMIDQQNSDYVKFAKACGLTDNEIFRKHIFKNAVIPIIHGIPGTILTALVGAIITEKVYVVPGAGNLLVEAIAKYDNGVIVGVTLFYTALGITSVILGDILMAMFDPRISFSDKAR